MSARLPLAIGTSIIAVRDFGPVREGAPGIITGIVEVPFFWLSRPMYLCTFADNLKVAARTKEINDYDHGYTIEEIENSPCVRLPRNRMSKRG